MSENPEKYPALLVPQNGHQRVIRFDQIIYCEAEGSYCNLFMTSAEACMVSHRLGALEELLPAYFFRCHHSFLINLHFISGMQETKILLHENKHSVKLSRSKRQEFRQLFYQL
ncbi:MAG: LytTR family transcriptional regulator [Lewinella sp.]|nr:LytTR family transcriptional regulator [Lewinella sp.]